jgi:predicted amidohydrolase YtcJ
MKPLILHNGTIHTLNPRHPRADALAIRDGRIVAVGSAAAVRAASGPHYDEINLYGHTILPGLTDSHVHLHWYGHMLHNVMLEQTRCLNDAAERIAAHRPSLSPESWLRGGGWSHSTWGHWPTRNHLDHLCPDHPAMLFSRDGHAIWVNSRALHLAGIDHTTPDPPGGHIQRDEQGNPTGILFEHAIELVQQNIPPHRPEERLQTLLAAQQHMLSYGLTSAHIPPSTLAGDGRQILSDLQVLRERGDLRVRCLLHIAAEDFDAALAMGLRSGFGDSWLRIGGLKIFTDGSLGSQTAEMLTPYAGSQSRGIATLPVETLNAMVARASRHGISVVLHAIGDAANRKALDAIHAAQQNSSTQEDTHARPALPHRIEHAQVLHPDDLPRFAASGIVASMQPLHAIDDMEDAERLWGERCAGAYAWRSLRQSGATLAFGSDAPVAHINPWEGIHAAVTRQRPDHTPDGGWYPNECLSLDEALHAYSTGPAQSSGERADKGMLAVGMLADMVILAHDPYQHPPRGLLTLSTVATLVAGHLQYGAYPTSKPNR